MTKYVQCTLIKKHYHSILQQVSFIPEKFAKLGEVISLRKHWENYWDNNWKISSVGSYVIEVNDDLPSYDIFEIFI
jgi:hypothetical protein